MTLQMKQLVPDEPWISPFDSSSDGFTDQWWFDQNYDNNDFLWTFSDHGIEVARALVSSTTINQVYKIHFHDLHTIDITFFEVRHQFRRKGIGRTAIHLLLSQYPNSLITAFSIADDFWRNIGFKFCQRQDKKDENDTQHRLYRPLFIYRT